MTFFDIERVTRTISFKHYIHAIDSFRAHAAVKIAPLFIQIIFFFSPQIFSRLLMCFRTSRRVGSVGNIGQFSLCP